MAGKERLNCLEKRDLLNQAAASPGTLSNWGQKFEEGGFLYDAVDFYEKAGAQDALERLLKVCFHEGDTFLYRRISRLLGREPEREEWIALSKNAEGLGKSCFAVQAGRHGGEEEMAEKLASGDPT